MIFVLQNGLWMSKIERASVLPRRAISKKPTRGAAQNIRLAMALRNSVTLALVFASNPAHALDLKKELERLRGGADAKETQTHATQAAAASLRGRAAFLDASRVAPPLSRLGAIVKLRVDNFEALSARQDSRFTDRFPHRSSPKTRTPSSATRISTRRRASRASASAATRATTASS